MDDIKDIFKLNQEIDHEELFDKFILHVIDYLKNYLHIPNDFYHENNNKWTWSYRISSLLLSNMHFKQTFNLKIFNTNVNKNNISEACEINIRTSHINNKFNIEQCCCAYEKIIYKNYIDNKMNIVKSIEVTNHKKDDLILMIKEYREELLLKHVNKDIYNIIYSYIPKNEYTSFESSAFFNGHHTSYYC